MLSLLQVVVATLFSQGVGFGVLLALYLLLGFSAMTLLMLYRQWDRYRPKTRRRRRPCTSAAPGAREPAAMALGGAAVRVHRRCRAARPGRPRGDLFARLGRMGRTPGAGAGVVLRRSAVWAGGLARSRWPSPAPWSASPTRSTLGELGQIIESRDEVMRVRFYRDPTNTPQPRPRRNLPASALADDLPARPVGGGRAIRRRLGSSLLHARRRPLPRRASCGRRSPSRRWIITSCSYVAPYFRWRPTLYVSIDHARQRLLRDDYLPHPAV